MKFFKYPALLGLLTLSLVATLTFTGAGEAAGTVVPLGTAGTFAVLAGSGITNTGATTINGDSGSDPLGTETGFNVCPNVAGCVTQTGTNHVTSDAMTLSAQAALANAYGVAAGQTPTTIPTDLSGQSLSPGVYTSASGTFLMSGTLTLNAGNDPNGVFIFQTADGTGTLTTSSAGNVSLLGQAQSCNVFWKVGSSATLIGGSTFRGTILASTSISVDAAVTVDGALLAGESGAGAVTLDNDTITTPTCAAPVAGPAPATTTATTATTTTATTTSTSTTTTPTGTTPSAAAAAARAARAAKAKAAASKAAASKAAAARVLAAQKAAVAKRAAALRRAAARKRAAAKRAATTSTIGKARPPVGRAGFTG